MAKQRLCRAERSPYRIEQRGVSMSKPMPIHFCQAKRLAHWLELTVEEIAPTKRGTIPGRKNQLGWVNLARLQ